jgi:phenylacetic acid degradation operon negative regulatory protein
MAAPTPLSAPHALIQLRLEELQRQNRIQAGSLMATVLGDAVLPRGGRVWLGSLIGLMELLGVNERLVRTTAFRMAKDDWLVNEIEGRRSNYGLTTVGRRRFDDAARHIYAARAPDWDRRWRLINVVGELSTRDRERLRRALVWQGFGELSTHTYIHPTADLQTCFDALHAEGLGPLTRNLVPLLAANPTLQGSASDGDLVRRAWDLEELSQGYDAFVVSYQPLLDEADGDKAPELTAEQAFVGRTLLIHDFRRLLLRDPELPAVLLPTNWSGQAARSLCQRIYAKLLPASEAYLDAHLNLANGDVPMASALIYERFGLTNPLDV